jgi:hypothetical protein
LKTSQVQFKANTAIDIALNPVAQIKPQLVILFGSRAMFERNGKAVEVSKHFSNALTIGCSTAGEISNHGVSDDTLVITGVHFDSEVTLKPVFAEIPSMQDTLSSGRRIGEQLDKPNLKAVFVLGRGLEINGSALIEGLRQILGPQTLITGGLAGDGSRFQQTFTILNGQLSDTNVVGFGIYGKSIQVTYGSSGGWEVFGPIRKVTKAKENILYELDGEPALEIYKKYLGQKAKDLPASGLLYPFAVLKDSQDSTGIIRTILAVDETSKSVTLAGDIHEGGLVRLMHSTNQGLIAGAEGAATATVHHMKGKHNDGLGILISCVGRKLVMGPDVEDELDAVRKVFGVTSTVTGFYSYGEICPTGETAESKLHNQTMTITYLYEAA